MDDFVKEFEARIIARFVKEFEDGAKMPAVTRIATQTVYYEAKEKDLELEYGAVEIIASNLNACMDFFDVLFSGYVERQNITSEHIKALLKAGVCAFDYCVSTPKNLDVLRQPGFYGDVRNYGDLSPSDIENIWFHVTNTALESFGTEKPHVR